MSEQTPVKEPQANPYNANKSWDTGEKHERGLANPNESLFRPAPDASAEAEATPVETAEQEVVDTKYKRVDYKKRYDDMKRHYDSKLIEWKAEQEKLETRIKATAPKTVPKTPEELATFKEEYPDVYDVVESVAHQQAKAQLEEVNKEIAELRSRETATAMREAQLLLEKLHPDFNEITETEEFHDWAKVQHATIQEWIYENPTDASLAARAIDLYKKDMGIGTDTQKVKPVRTKREVDAAEVVLIKDAVDPTLGDKKTWTTSEIENLSIAQFEANQLELDAAFKEGRIIQG